MKNNIEEYTRRHLFGIYLIKIDTVAKKYFYIGSTTRTFNNRLLKHVNELKKRKHHNKILQKLYNKYGFDNFEYKVLEIVQNKKEIQKREQYFIDLFLFIQNEKLIVCNHQLFAYSNYGNIQSKESIEKSVKTRKWLYKNDPEYKQVILAAAKRAGETKRGRKQSKEHVEKALNGRLRPYNIRLIGPNKEIIEPPLINLMELCRKLNIRVNHLYEVINGTRQSVGGWRIEYVNNNQ